ncbi:MAG: WhiB family transcriptional regulator [Mycobacterium sp.]|jgi:WhiB family redox-sensing transcriptional regulator|nr:WhiB family transcriptional regulator [Mycobacterium sp.]
MSVPSDGGGAPVAERAEAVGRALHAGPSAIGGDTADLAWRGRAACYGNAASLFFPPPHFERKPEKDARESAARELCRACPVRRRCLAYALSVDEPHGIWGGLNELQRARLRRTRAELGLTAAEAACLPSAELPPPGVRGRRLPSPRVRMAG